MKVMWKSHLVFGALAALVIGTSSLTGPATVATNSQSPEVPKPEIWLQISPVSSRISLSPGKTVEDSFTVENIGTKAFNYRVYATPYYVNNENYDLNFGVQNNYTQIARWISFQDANGNYTADASFHIDTKGKQTVKYRVVVPEDVPAGGQYATLFAESVGDESQAQTASTGIKTRSRVGLVLYANVGGTTRQKAEIRDYDFTKFTFSGNLKANAKIKNAGNTDFSSTVSYTVKSLFGKTLYTKSNSFYILPETERRVKIEWENTPLIGAFQVNYRVSAQNTVREETHFVLVMPVFVLVLGILLLTVMVIWIIIAIRKRKERKSRLLV